MKDNESKFNSLHTPLAKPPSKDGTAGEYDPSFVKQEYAEADIIERQRVEQANAKRSLMSFNSMVSICGVLQCGNFCRKDDHFLIMAVLFEADQWWRGTNFTAKVRQITRISRIFTLMQINWVKYQSISTQTV
jgi:hypothetical protein